MKKKHPAYSYFLGFKLSLGKELIVPKYVPRKTCFHKLVCFRLMLAYLGYTFGITVEIYHVRTLLKLGGSSETGFLSDLAPLQPAERDKAH